MQVQLYKNNEYGLNLGQVDKIKKHVAFLLKRKCHLLKHKQAKSYMKEQFSSKAKSPILMTNQFCKLDLLSVRLIY